MHDVILRPNLRKLGQYFNLTEEMILEVEESEGIPMALDYLTEDSYNILKEKFNSTCEHYSISAHFEELFFLLVRHNEEINKRYEVYSDNYYDDLTTREVAKFLLAYKEADKRTYLTLSLKPSIGSTATLKDTRVVKWICKVVVEQIEKGNYPLDVLGEKICYDLFGGFHNEVIPLDIDRLRAAAKLAPRKPTTILKSLHAELVLYLRNFLIEHTEMKVVEGKMITDAHANFYFDTLEALGYLDRDKINSDPKDYMWAMIVNYIKSIRSRQ